MFCRDCGKIIDEKGGNAKKYCSECAKRRKKAQDKAFYIRKRQKERQERNNSSKNKRKIAEEMLYREHSEYLGISVSYYPIWKKQFPDLHKEYMDSKLGPFEE